MALHVTHTPAFDQAPVSSATIDLLGTLKRLRRRQRLIVGIVVACVLASLPLILSLQPDYIARAAILFDPLQRHLFDSKSGMKELPVSEELVAGQIEVIRSRKVIGRVVQSLDLVNNDDLNPHDDPNALIAWLDVRGLIGWAVDEARGALAAYIPGLADQPSAPPPAVTEEDMVIDEVTDRLGVRQMSPGPVLRLTFKAEDPALAARVVNAVADEYLAYQREAKAKLMDQTVQWLDERIAMLQSEVDKRERAVVAFRSASGLVQGSGAAPGQNLPLASQEIAEVLLRMAQARAENKTMLTQLEQVEALLRRTGNPEAASEVIESPLVQNLKRELVLARKQLADASSSGAELHPRVVAARAQVNDLQASLRAEVDKIVANLRTRVTLASEQERALADLLGTQYERAGSLNEKEVQLRALQRDADVSLATLQAFLARSKEISEFVSNSPIDAEVISYASTPDLPNPPTKSTLLIVAAFGATLVAITLALVLDFVDGTIRTRDQAELVTGRPMLELLPAVAVSRRRRVADRVIDEPRSIYTESLRSLSTTLLHSTKATRGTKILVTSPLPREGKTTLALSLGRVLAMGRRKVVVIDCDLRRAGLRAALGEPRMAGVTDYVAGTAELEGLLRHDTRSPLVYMLSGTRTDDPMAVLGSPRMRTLLDLLASRFDVVLIDVPPVLAANDVRLFSGLVDRTLMLVSWASTRRETVAAAIRRLSDVDMYVDGVVLSRVDLKRYAQYDHAYNYEYCTEKGAAAA